MKFIPAPRLVVHKDPPLRVPVGKVGVKIKLSSELLAWAKLKI